MTKLYILISTLVLAAMLYGSGLLQQVEQIASLNWTGCKQNQCTDVNWSSDISWSSDVSWSSDISWSSDVSWSSDISWSSDVSWSSLNWAAY